MGTNKNLHKAVHEKSIADQSPNTAETSIRFKSGSNLKKLIFAVSLAGAALFFNGCSAGYVATEPSYMQYDRPSRPNEYAIWIEGDWRWNNRSQQYYQKNGYWENPRHGQTYTSGYWQATPRGKTWTKGHWQSLDNQKENLRHRHNQDYN